MHQGPKEDVGGKENVYVDIVYQDDVQYEEPEGNPDDRMPGAADGHADGHELVMDMATVRGEGAPPVENPVDEKPHHVQHRDQKDGEGIHEIVVPLVRRYGGMVCESGRLYGERRHDEAHGKGPRVPHEYLRLLLGGTVHVVDIEGQEGAESRCTQYCISGKPYLHEQDGENSYAHDTQAGGKAVYPVDEVYGIDDEHNKHDGERDAYQGRYVVDAEDTVEIVYPEARDAQQHGRDYLYRELYPVRQPHQVVGHTGHVKEQGACRTEHYLRRVRREVTGKPGLGQHAEHDQDRNHDTGQESHPSQPRDLSRMYLPVVRHIEKLLLEGDVDDLRNSYDSQYHTDQE